MKSRSWISGKVGKKMGGGWMKVKVPEQGI
jgi:hypothetical protein